jgi:hypothetical protein
VLSLIHLSDVFLTDSGYCDTVFKFQQGYGGILENIACDFEGTYPATAYVWCDVGPNLGAQGTRLTLRKFVAGTLGRTTTLIELVGPSGPTVGYAASMLLLENVGAYGGYAPGSKFPPSIPGIWSINDLDI